MATDTARIPLPEPDEMTGEQRAVFDAIVSGRRGTLVGPLRAALHSPPLADSWQKLGEVLRYNTVFPPRDSELAILVTARRWNCELEWVIHREAARAAGLSDAICDAIKEQRLPTFEDQDQAEIYAFTAALQNTGQVPPQIHAAITKRWGAIGVVELTAITGYYAMVAITLNSHGIPLPADRVPELYPDGQQPPAELSHIPEGSSPEAGSEAGFATAG